MECESVASRAGCAAIGGTGDDHVGLERVIGHAVSSGTIESRDPSCNGIPSIDNLDNCVSDWRHRCDLDEAGTFENLPRSGVALPTIDDHDDASNAHEIRERYGPARAELSELDISSERLLVHKDYVVVTNHGG